MADRWLACVVMELSFYFSPKENYFHILILKLRILMK